MLENEPSSAAREKVLDAASALFYAHGIKAVGVDLIIAQADVARATFYKHFPAKDDLVVAFLNRRDAMWRAWLGETVGRLAAEPADRPLAIFDALFERFSAGDFRGCAFINSIVELANRDHPAHIAADTHKRAVTAQVAQILADAGYPDPDLARSFVMLVDGAIVTALRESSPDAASRARSIAQALLAASPRNARRAKHAGGAQDGKQGGKS